jgi:hypothetical protein
MAAKRITLKTTKGDYVSAIQAVAGDSQQAFATASVVAVDEAQLNENATVYKLYPYDLNDIPVITKNILESSTPRIVSEQAFSLNNTGSAALLYYDDTRTIRIVAGESITLRVEAQQPTTLNVENGVPLLKQVDDDLTFLWAKDGAPLTPADSELYNDTFDKIIPEVNQLRLVNVSARMAGTYTCDITNDIGTTTTEDITIEVLTPNLPNDPFFGLNLVQNGFATDGTSGWTVTRGGFTTKKLLRGDLDVQARTPHTNVFGYSANCIYPYPGNIITKGIRGLDYSQLLGKQGSYFTRDGMDYAVNGGVQQAIMYQDIDLSDITDYISGKAYGAQGVRAHFGFFVGNAITRYIPTVDIVGPDERYNESFYYSGAPRISYENFALAGFGLFEERAIVTIQEYENNTLLPSGNPGSQNFGGFAPTDTLLDAFQNPTQAWVDYLKTPVLPASNDPVVAALPPISESAPMRVLNLYNALYPTRPEFRYNYGQYADWKSIQLDKLNPRTNKIRITVRFDCNSGRLNETDPLYTEQSMREFEPFRKPRKKLYLTEFENSIRDIFNNNQSSQYKDKPLMEQIAPGNASKLMATGFGLVLEPITKATGNAATYRRRLFDMPTRTSSSIIPNPFNILWTDNETRPVPTNPFSTNTSFAQAISNDAGVAAILDILGTSYAHTFRRFNHVKYWGYADRAEYSYDGNGLRGRLIISNLSTGGNQLVNTSEDYNDYPDNSNNPIPFSAGGGEILRIEYIAGNRNDFPENDNWQDKLFPWVYARIVNTAGPYTAGGSSYWVSLWPKSVPAGKANASPLSNYKINLDGNSLAVYDSGAGVAPRNIASEDQAPELYSRTIQIDIPANQVAEVWAGVRYGDEFMTNNVTNTKVEFVNNQLVYYRV